MPIAISASVVAVPDEDRIAVRIDRDLGLECVLAGIRERLDRA
jgi:hypothetical protein